MQVFCSVLFGFFSIETVTRVAKSTEVEGTRLGIRLHAKRNLSVGIEFVVEQGLLFAPHGEVV